MSAKPVVSMEGNLRYFGGTSSDLAEEREALDPAKMAEMLYSGFESNVTQLAEERGIVMPPPTDMSGRPLSGWENFVQAQGQGQGQGRGMERVAGVRPPSSSEGAISVLMENREDMLHEFSAVSQDPLQATKLAMRIQKVEAQIISLGGELDRFDPSKYQSGLRPIGQNADPMVAANKVSENTQQAYTLRKIASITTGKNKAGKAGIAIKIENGPGSIIHGTVVPKVAFSGNEVIDYVPDNGKGRMTVKTASRGYWEDVSSDFEIGWRIEQV